MGMYEGPAVQAEYVELGVKVTAGVDEADGMVFTVGVALAVD